MWIFHGITKKLRGVLSGDGYQLALVLGDLPLVTDIYIYIYICFILFVSKEKRKSLREYRKMKKIYLSSYLIYFKVFKMQINNNI